MVPLVENRVYFIILLREVAFNIKKLQVIELHMHCIHGTKIQSKSRTASLCSMNCMNSNIFCKHLDSNRKYLGNVL
jgi:hypothetical protein